MKDLFNQSLAFIKRNPAIIYSIFLIIAVSGIIFFNTYYSVIKFQKNNDILLHSKAVLAEDIFNLAIAEDLDNYSKIESLIEKIKAKDNEILEINILKPTESRENFKIIASTNQNKVGQEITEDLNLITWNHPQEGVAYLNYNDKGRFWQVSKVIQTADGKKGIVIFDVSLAESDALINQTIQRMYWVSILSLMIVLLLIGNHARLFSYALRVTKLEEVDKMKDDFISMASHELRMPLTIINGYAELLKESIDEEEKDKKTKNYEEKMRQLKNIKIASKRLRELVEDILDVSRIQEGRLKIKLVAIDISQLAEDIVEQFKVNAIKKKLDLELKKETHFTQVKADQNRVKQILVNLIGNAIKYTKQGKVTVIIREDQDFIKVIVKDTGIGMSAQELKNLFSKFYRARNKQTEEINGTGLGLWISRELARKMGGNIEVESMEGVGSQFILKLPKAKK